MLTRTLAASAALRTTSRRWVVALVVIAIALASAWLSLALTPPASVRIGIVSAEIKAAPGSGTEVRTALGRPVTDATVNNGPLQVQVALAVSPHPSLTEPELLEALGHARPRVIHAAIGYLLRVVAGAIVLSLLGCALVFGRRPRRLGLAAATTVAVVATGVGSTAASTRLSTFDAASCAHGWSQYALADVPDLTPPAPTVSPPPEATAAANPGLIPVVLISDDHLNPEGLVFARRLQTATHAVAVLDAGDTTSYGVPGEACVVAPLIRAFRVPYVWVRGNHDSAAFARTMRSLHGVRVLDGTTATVAGLGVFGVGDPSFTPRRHVSAQVMAANAAGLRATMPSLLSGLDGTPDVVLVHECRAAVSGGPANAGVAGIAPLVVCGHTHRYSVETVDGTTVLHTGTVGAGGLGAFEVGELRDFDAQLLLFSADSHRLVRYYDVNGAGGRPASFTRYDVETPGAPVLRPWEQREAAGNVLADPPGPQTTARRPQGTSAG